MLLSSNRSLRFNRFRLRRFRARGSDRLRAAGSLKEIDRSITAVYAIAGIENRRSDEGKDNARANEDEKSDTF